MEPIVLRTARLVISSRSLEEMETLYQNEPCAEMKQAYREMCDTMMRQPDDGVWSCDWKIALPGGDTVGGIGFKGKADKRGMVDVGYGINEPYRRLGFAKEALGAMTDFALSHKEVHAVTAEAEKDNTASLRTIASHGFLPYGKGEEGLVFVRFRKSETPVFRKVSDYPRGTLLALLTDGYRFDGRCFTHWGRDWEAFDRFFYDNISIADRYGFITEIGGQPIGLFSWDPRKQPAFAQIGHNCIVSAYKGKGYGAVQLSEAVRRISLGDAEKIRVTTSGFLSAAQHMYERVGFCLVKTRKNEGIDAFSGDCLDYEYIL